MAAKFVIIATLLAAANAGIIGGNLGLVGLGSPLGLGLGHGGSILVGGPQVVAAPIALASPAVAVSSQSITRTISPQLISAGPSIVAGPAHGILSAGHGAALVGPSAPATKLVGPDGGVIAAPGIPGGVVSIGASNPGLVAASAPIGLTRVVAGPAIGLSGHGIGLSGHGIGLSGLGGLGLGGLIL